MRAIGAKCGIRVGHASPSRCATRARRASVLDQRSTRLPATTNGDGASAGRGENFWKGLYSVASVVGLVLIVWGYGLARQQPVQRCGLL